MKRAPLALCLLALVTLLAAALAGCQPCEDPSQVWCPDEWQADVDPHTPAPLTSTSR